MHGYTSLDAAHQRQASFRAEAAAKRLAKLAPRARIPARRRVANLIVAIGFVVVGAGRRLDGEMEAQERYRLRAIS